MGHESLIIDILVYVNTYHIYQRALKSDDNHAIYVSLAHIYYKKGD